MPNSHHAKNLIFVSGFFLFLGIFFYHGAELDLEAGADVVVNTNNRDDQPVDVTQDFIASASEESSGRDTEVLVKLSTLTIDELLGNMNDPQIQAYIQSLPDDAQESFYLASLKQSVSKRLDEIEDSNRVDTDIDKLFEDLDILAQHRVMMPGEVESLKAYVSERL